MDLGLLLFPAFVFLFSITSLVIDMGFYQRRFTHLNYNSSHFDCENLVDTLMFGVAPQRENANRIGQVCLLPNSFIRNEHSENTLEEIFDQTLERCEMEGC